MASAAVNKFKTIFSSVVRPLSYTTGVEAGVAGGVAAAAADVVDSDDVIAVDVVAASSLAAVAVAKYFLTIWDQIYETVFVVTDHAIFSPSGITS